MYEGKFKEMLTAHEAIKQHIRHICAIAPRLVTEMLQDQSHGPRKEAGVLTVIGSGESFCLMMGERTVVFAMSMKAPAPNQHARIQISLHRNIGIGDAVVTRLGEMQLDTKGQAQWEEGPVGYDTTNPEQLREVLAHALLLALMH